MSAIENTIVIKSHYKWLEATLKKDITGYWMFVCNPARWQIDRFIESGETKDTYSISNYHKDYFQPGQKGIIRIGNDSRSKKVLGNKPRLQPGIYALVEIISIARKIPSTKKNYWKDSNDATKVRPRVELKYISTDLKNPVLLKDLIGTSVEIEDPLVINGYQGSSYPITETTYNLISSRIDQPASQNSTTQQIDIVKFDYYFNLFSTLVKKNSPTEFSSFRNNAYLQEQEGYKDEIFIIANQKLAIHNWSVEDIGTGRIFDNVAKALKSSKNLVPWQDVDNFKQLKNNISLKELESAFFNLYTKRQLDERSFKELQTLLPNHYSLMAYLFFIKDRNQFLPISTTRLKKGLMLLGIESFILTRNCGWNNYVEFIQYIKQVRTSLTEFGIQEVTLLDAHSFVWIIANIEEKLLAHGIEDHYQTKNMDEYNKLPTKDRETIIKARIGQGPYRKALIDYWEMCSVTGCELQTLLTASHIKPWASCNILEAKDCNNGLLLIPNLDRVFDQGLISFADNGKVIISSQLKVDDMILLGITNELNLQKNLNNSQRKYLKYHRENIFKA